MAITSIAAVPNTDHKIFFDKCNGFLFERTATIFAYSDEAENIKVVLAEKLGDRTEDDVLAEDIDEKDDYEYEYIGTIGDTITPKQLAPYLKKENEDDRDGIYVALDYAERHYFHFDKTQAEDTVHVKLNHIEHKQRHLMEVSVESDWFANIFDPWYSLFDADEFMDCDRCDILDKNIIVPLAQQALFLGRTNLDIKLDPVWVTNVDLTEQERDAQNERLYKIYSLYYKAIESYIKGGIKAEIDKVTAQYNEWEETKRKEKEYSDKYNNKYKF